MFSFGFLGFLGAASAAPIFQKKKEKSNMKMPSEQLWIYTKIKALLVEFGHAKNAISPTASFVNDLGFDSLDVAEMALQMELLFDVEISFEKVETNCGTVGELVRTILALQKGHNEHPANTRAEEI